jgi:hypothetical protein
MKLSFCRGYFLSCVGLISSVFAGSIAQAVQNQALSGHVLPAAVRSRPAGDLPESTVLQLGVGLPLRNQPALNTLLADLYNPASPGYHQFLTADQFAEQFGPAEQDYQAVIAYLVANGFTVTRTFPNRMIVDVSGTVGDIQRAFHLNMGLYQHPTEGRNFFAPDSEPVLDLAVPVLHITGLDNFVVPRPASLVVGPVGQPQGGTPLSGTGPGGTYMGLDFRKSYAPGVTLNGSGQMVGLLQFDRFHPSDITAYEALAGLPNVPVQEVVLDDIATIGNNNVEVALDIEMSISMAPGLAMVIVYEGLASNDILNRMATDNLAKQLSASWTYGVDATTAQVFQQFGAQGQSFFNASGDSDAYSGAAPSPVDNANITAVGGTVLTTRTLATGYISETTWNWLSTGQGNAGTGGGISTTVGIPSYQQGIDMTANQGSITARNVPDVAMVADNVLVVANNGQQLGVGGTSVASPLWAGFMALVNQQAVARGRSTVGFLNPAVYALGKSTNYAAAFHDTTTGNNTNSGSPTKFFAVTGYDLCTGWGTPTGSNLINVLAPFINSRIVTNVSATLVAEGCTPTNGVIDAGETVIVNFALHNIGGVNTTNLVATLLATGGVVAPSGPQTYGALVGGGGTVTQAFTFSAGGACGSVLTASIQLQDGATSLGTLTFPFQTGVPIVPFSESFDGVTAPALPAGWTRSVITGGSNWVSTTASRDSSPNAMFAFESTNAGVAELTSPAFPITSSTAQLVFRNSYNSEIDPTNLTKAYDGGVLEIKVGTAAFQDILAAGGSFVTGGYQRTIDPTDDNPLDNRQCWSGNSGGFITTIVNLPASAAGKNIQLKWRFGTDTDNAYGSGGWYIDSVVVKDGYTCCNLAAPVISTQPSNQVAVVGSNATFNVVASGTPPLSYQWLFTSTNLPGATSSVLQLTNVQLSQAGNYQVLVTNASGSATSSVVTLRVLVPPTLNLSRLGVTPTNVSISLTSVLGLNYTLQYKNSLTDANWTPLPPPVTGNGDVITLQDSTVGALPSRFYRVLCN